MAVQWLPCNAPNGPPPIVGLLVGLVQDRPDPFLRTAGRTTIGSVQPIVHRSIFDEDLVFVFAKTCGV